MLRESGSPVVRARVNELLRSGRARLVPIVRLELWNGAQGDRERNALRHLEEVVPEIPTTPEIWDEAFDLARRARAAGVTVPAADLIIAACARRHGAAVEASDGHFAELSGL
jgi:predicted nucleic acid-binding protein